MKAPTLKLCWRPRLMTPAGISLKKYCGPLPVVSLFCWPPHLAVLNISRATDSRPTQRFGQKNMTTYKIHWKDCKLWCLSCNTYSTGTRISDHASCNKHKKSPTLIVNIFSADSSLAWSKANYRPIWTRPLHNCGISISVTIGCRLEIRSGILYPRWKNPWWVD